MKIKTKKMKKTILFGTLIILGLASCTKEEVKPSETSTAVQNYTNFKITSILLNDLPFTDSQSASWDPFDGPDVYFNIQNKNNDVLFDGSESKFSDLNYASLPLKWTFNSAFQITNFELYYYITFFDYDTFGSNANIGYVAINFNQHKTGYPTSITKTSNDGSISVTINGNWY
jgi:hypothetical protein